MRSAFLSALMLVSSLCFAELPSPEELKQAVEKSRAKYVKDHPPPTKEEVLAVLQRRLTSANVALDRASRIAKKSERNAKRKELFDTIESLKKEIRKTEKAYKPAEVTPQLSRLDYRNLETGSVGAFNDNTVIDDRHVVVECLKILGDDRILAAVNLRVLDGNVDRSEGEVLVVLQGIDTSMIVEGARLRSHRTPVVVTGEGTFTTKDGTPLTVTVLEVFDPEKL